MQDKPQAVRPTYGFTPDDPILGDEFSGMFIRSLRCPNGHHLRGHRVGSVEGKCTDRSTHREPMRDLMAARFPGWPPSPDVIDRYDLTCDGGEYSCSLYFDIYHPRRTTTAPTGGTVEGCRRGLNDAARPVVPGRVQLSEAFSRRQALLIALGNTQR
jgi:hypothetical protein